MTVICPFSEAGCNWEGKFEEYKQHTDVCDFASVPCEYCREIVFKDQLKAHIQSCPSAPRECPLAALGCTLRSATSRDELLKHMEEEISQHFSILAVQVQGLEKRLDHTQLQVSSDSKLKEGYHLKLEQKGLLSREREWDFVEADGAHDSGVGQSLQNVQLPQRKTQFVAQLQNTESSEPMRLGLDKDVQTMIESIIVKKMTKMKDELKGNITSELRVKDEELAELRTTITKLEKTLRSKNAELEDRDFRLSLIENSNHDGSMIWKIPQFSQRKADAENGKYTSIFSLPFYSCLLYTSPSPRDATLSRMPSSA